MSEDQSRKRSIGRGPTCNRLPFSRSAKAGQAISASGMIGRDEASGVFDKDGFGAQTKAGIKAIRQVTEDAGEYLDIVVKAALYVTDLSRFVEADEPPKCAFKEGLPARHGVELSSLSEAAAQVEIDVTVSRRGER